MSIFKTLSGGKTARCSFSTMLFMAFLAISFSGLAQAQGIVQHGVSISKGCIDEVRTCTDNLSCSDNLCLPETCNQDIPDTTYCEIVVSYNDDNSDTVTINEAWDIMDFGGDDVRVPAAGNMPIVRVSGNTTCMTTADGGSLPCDILPAGGLEEAGEVVFASNEYMPQPGDGAVLDDKAFTIVQDLCDGDLAGQANCSLLPKEANAVALTSIVEGCVPEDPVTCDDNNACTADSCDTVTGDCIFGPPTVCDDGNACTADSCNTITGDCEFGPPTVCDDGNACTADSCNTSTGDCEFGPPTVCDDGNACTADSCNTVTGDCESGPPTVCDDGNACTADSCNTVTGDCESGPPTVCDDGNACTADSCNTITGDCEFGPPTVCDDGNACTADSCNTVTGDCESGPPTVCDDNNACTADSCNTITGDCEFGPPTVCDDGNACTADSCNTITGDCESGPPTVCDDGNACTEDSCNTITGDCESGPPTVCDDGDVCTLDSCDTASGECVYVDDPDATDPSCFTTEICRTPGFWASHGGDSKNRSTDITQAVIDGSDAGYLSVCGAQIDTTDPDVMWSTSNAMCTAVKGVTERQLVRQLTAMALNCVMSGGDGDCSGTALDGLADECNALCAGADVDVRTMNDCIAEIDCFNNGGAWDGDSCIAWMGYCSENTEVMCDSDDDSGCVEFGEVCVREDSCHDLELCQGEEPDDLCFVPPGPAGGTNNCKLAKKNGTYLPY